VNLANLYEGYGQMESAKDHFKEAHRLANICLGDDNPETQKVLEEFHRVEAALESKQLEAVEKS
jgi:hypothetical protein